MAAAKTVFHASHRPGRDPADEAALAEARTKTDRVGIFWFVDFRILPSGMCTGLSDRMKTLLEHVEPFFAASDRRVLREYVVPTNNEDVRLPALRTIDFALTNTFGALPYKAVRTDRYGTEIHDPHLSYTKELQNWHRECYDPFRRRERVFFVLDGATHYTTVGQLHFWKWAIESGTYSVIVDREPEILAHSRTQAAEDRRLSASRSREKRKRRSSLSEKPRLKMSACPTHSTMKFD